MDSPHRTHYQQQPSSSSKSNSGSSAEQKRSKFQRSGGSKHAGSSSSLTNVGVTGGGGGGGTSLSSTAPSPSHSLTSSRGGSTAKNSIISSKSASSNKSQSISSIVLSNLLAEVGEVVNEDDRPILSGVPIRAASLPALVHVCIRAFDYKGEILKELENFPQVLFLMHQWFCPSSTEFASLFITQFNECSESLAPCHEPSCLCHGCYPAASSGDGLRFYASPTFTSSKITISSGNLSVTGTSSPVARAKKILLKGTSAHLGNSGDDCFQQTSQEGRFQQQLVSRCRTMRYRASVCQSLRYWIKKFPLHFDVDDRLHDIMETFTIQLEAEGYLEWSQWLDLSNIPSYDWLRNHSVKESEASRPYRKVSLIFNHLEPDELAHHVTYLEHKIMRRITFQDFKTYAENGTLEDNPVLERSVSLFNGLSQWIQYVVLNRPTPVQRADVIAKFVHVAENLRKLQNFNSLMGVVGSLSHSALARLSKTMDCVPAEERKVLSELTILVSSSNNFRQYRKALSVCTGFKIPILGVHLKDLISLHTALPDNIENGLINFRKMTQLYLIFKELQDLQQSMPPAEANNDLLNTLKLSLDFNYSEDELYELSLSREPRASNSISPTRGPGQQENANGSYEKQVQAMVDAVFRNYDLNGDGLISREEFQALSNNFPAIDAFFVVDENRDGMISKLELERYLRNRKNAGTSHNFHEQTYFKPTFCIHCSGLLWGLIKQGYKCRMCGVNAHKYCKDYMLHECKMGQLFYFPSPEPQAKRKGFRIRKKSSSQSESGSPPSPKFFNSLEQLSMSTESTDMPTSTSSSAIHVYGSSGNISIGISSSNSGVVAGGPQIKSPQHAATATSAATAEPEHQHQESISRGTKKGLHSPFHGTPKGTRRFSILSSSTNTGRSCSSVPSSPKLSGLSSISIPLLSPCRTFFGHLTTNNSSSNERHAQKSNKNTSSTAPSSISAAGSRHSGGTTLTVITNTTTTGGGGAKSFTPVFGSSSTSSSPKEIPSQKQKSPHVSNDT